MIILDKLKWQKKANEAKSLQDVHQSLRRGQMSCLRKQRIHRQFQGENDNSQSGKF